MNSLLVPFKVRFLFAAVLPFAGGLARAQTTATATHPVQTASEVVVLSDFVVNESDDQRYSAKYTTGATRINMEIQKAPLAVTVFNNQFMQDVAALDIQEIARYTAGATATVHSR